MFVYDLSGSGFESLENDTVEKTVKYTANIILLNLKIIKNTKKRDYHDLYLKVHVLKQILKFFIQQYITKEKKYWDNEKVYQDSHRT